MAAGDRSLYVDCYTMFEAMSKKWFFMGDVGTGAKMKVIMPVEIFYGRKVFRIFRKMILKNCLVGSQCDYGSSYGRTCRGNGPRRKMRTGSSNVT